MPLLLLHQSPGSSNDWFGHVPLLREAGIRVIAMDNPGMGMSDPFAFTPVLADYIDAVPAVLDHAGVLQADIGGYHTGVQVGVEASVRHARRVRSLMLYGVPVLGKAERDQLWNAIVPNEIEGAVHRPVPGGSNLSDHFRRLEGYFAPVTAQRMVLAALMAGPLWWHGHNAALRHDLAPALRAVTQPMLMMTNAGEMLDSNTRQAARMRPDATLVDLGVTTSVGMDDAPEAMVRAMLAFRAQLES